MRDIVIKIVGGLFVGIAFIFPSLALQSAEAQSDFPWFRGHLIKP